MRKTEAMAKAIEAAGKASKERVAMFKSEDRTADAAVIRAYAATAEVWLKIAQELA